MDVASYVSNVGEQINNHTKYCVKLDRTSITNLVIIKHLDELVKWTEDHLDDERFCLCQCDVLKLKRYINELKKQINFYPITDIDSDCILTEDEDHIITESDYHIIQES